MNEKLNSSNIQLLVVIIVINVVVSCPQALDVSASCLSEAAGHASASCQARELKLLSLSLQVTVVLPLQDLIMYEPK